MHLLQLSHVWVLLFILSHCQSDFILPPNTTDLGNVTLPKRLHLAPGYLVGSPETWNVTVVEEHAITSLNRTVLSFGSDNDKRRRASSRLSLAKRFNRIPGQNFEAQVAGTSLGLFVAGGPLAPRSLIGAALAGFWSKITELIYGDFGVDGGRGIIIGPKAIPLTDAYNNKWWFSVFTQDDEFLTWAEWKAVCGTLYGMMYQQGISRAAEYSIWDLGSGRTLAHGYFESGPNPTDTWYDGP